MVVFCVVVVVFSCLSESFFPKNLLSGIPSNCQTILIQTRSNIVVRPGLGPNCLQRLSADVINKTNVTLLFQGRQLQPSLKNMNSRVFKIRG